MCVEYRYLDILFWPISLTKSKCAKRFQWKTFRFWFLSVMIVVVVVSVLFLWKAFDRNKIIGTTNCNYRATVQDLRSLISRVSFWWADRPGEGSRGGQQSGRPTCKVNLRFYGPSRRLSIRLLHYISTGFSCNLVMQQPTENNVAPAARRGMGRLWKSDNV